MDGWTDGGTEGLRTDGWHSYMKFPHDRQVTASIIRMVHTRPPGLGVSNHSSLEVKGYPGYRHGPGVLVHHTSMHWAPHRIPPPRPISPRPPGVQGEQDVFRHGLDGTSRSRPQRVVEGFTWVENTLKFPLGAPLAARICNVVRLEHFRPWASRLHQDLGKSPKDVGQVLLRPHIGHGDSPNTL